MTERCIEQCDKGRNIKDHRTIRIVEGLLLLFTLSVCYTLSHLVSTSMLSWLAMGEFNMLDMVLWVTHRGLVLVQCS